MRARESAGKPALQGRASSLVISILCGFFCAGHLPAQYYGRWWWSASASYGEDQYWPDFRASDESSGSESLGLELGLHGYLGHPLVGSWDLAMTSSSTSSKIRGGVKSSGIGYNGSLTLFPRGGYPSSFSFSRQNWDVQALTAPTIAPSFVSRQTTASGAIRFKVGRLRGLKLNLQNREVEFSDPETEPQRFQEARLRWSGAHPSRRTMLSTRFDAQDYGSLDATRQAVNVQFDQSKIADAGWFWSYSLDGAQETLGSPNLQSTSRDLRASWTAQIAVRERDHVGLGFNAAWAETEIASVQGYGFNLSYLWRPKLDLEITSAAAVTRLEQPGLSQTISSGGLGLSWSARSRLVDSRLSLRTDFSIQDETTATQPRSSWSYSVALSLRSPAGVRFPKYLEATYRQNELRLDRLEIDFTPDAPLIAALVESQSGSEVRTGISAAAKRTSAHFSASASEGKVEFFGGGTAKSTSAQGSLALRAGSLSVSLGTGHSEFDSVQGSPVSSNYASLAATWAPFRVLRFQALARQDEQDSRLLPAYTQQRFEAGAEFEWGFLSWNISLFQIEDQFEGEAGRATRGIRWRITRRFAGWLPIRTAIRRRGVIR